MTNKESGCHEDKKEDGTMSAVARNYVYEVKTTRESGKNEKVVSKKMLAMCKEVASKYPKK